MHLAIPFKYELTFPFLYMASYCMTLYSKNTYKYDLILGNLLLN